MEKMIPLLAVAAAACGGVEGLTSEDLFGLSPQPKVWLAGLITNARTGAPLSGVSVQVGGRSTVSDLAGAYRLDGLDAVDTVGSASVHGFQVFTLSLTLRAGSNARDIALEPQECGRYSCAGGEFCDAENGQCVAAATLTGGVVSACDGAGLDARVSIDGWSTCSSGLSGKAYFQLENLTPGGPHTLSVGKVGWQAWLTEVTLAPGYNTLPVIALTPLGGCEAGAPAYMVCSCTDSACQ
jgi:hypothetical protein